MSVTAQVEALESLARQLGQIMDEPDMDAFERQALTYIVVLSWRRRDWQQVTVNEVATFMGIEEEEFLRKLKRKTWLATWSPNIITGSQKYEQLRMSAWQPVREG